MPYFTSKPFPLSGSSDVVPIVAPFMSDVDLRHGGNVYSRISTDPTLLDSVSFQGAKLKNYILPCTAQPGSTCNSNVCNIRLF